MASFSIEETDKQHRIQYNKVVEFRASLAKTIAKRIDIERKLAASTSEERLVNRLQTILKELKKQEKESRIQLRKQEFLCDGTYMNWVLAGCRHDKIHIKRLPKLIYEAKERASKYRQEYEASIENSTEEELILIRHCERQQFDFIKLMEKYSEI